MHNCHQCIGKCIHLYNQQYIEYCALQMKISETLNECDHIDDLYMELSTRLEKLNEERLNTKKNTLEYKSIHRDMSTLLDQCEKLGEESVATHDRYLLLRRRSNLLRCWLQQ